MSVRKRSSRDYVLSLSEESRNEHRVNCPKGDLGLTFLLDSKKGPAIVESVNSDGPLFMQVDKGWQLLKINDRAVVSNNGRQVTQFMMDTKDLDPRVMLFKGPRRAKVSVDSSGCFTVNVPPGPLGVAFANGAGRGPVVQVVKPASPVASAEPGSILRAVDGIDTSKMTCTEVATLLLERASRPERKLTFEAPYESPWPERLLLSFIVVLAAIAVRIVMHAAAAERESALIDEAAFKAQTVLSQLSETFDHAFLSKVVGPAL